MVSITVSTMRGESPTEGSSMRRSLDRDIRARPIDNWVCSPPLKLPAALLRRSPKAGNKSKTLPMSARISLRLERVVAPSSRLSLTDISAKTSRPWGTCTMPRRTIACVPSPAVSSPRNRTDPLLGVMSPLRALSSVLLPEPLPPSRATTDRSLTENETSRSTSVTPYQTLRCCTSSIDLLSQISLDHGRIFANFFRPTICNLLTRVEHNDTIGHSHDQADHVLDHDEGNSLLVADAAEKLI